ncbi:arginine exporter ArgO [Xenorhabdus nematophila]|uniref:arginine exporter ArgO n=1 Tax=Xenorhabdus nematophila TaxID=628 RepID=UPI0005427770|nr:arginine exporter ArgO [Xenorhabdus nematophila]CEF30819.1 putative amino acid transport protein (LYSE family) [Xenorhabdus nematophila str. Websteri]AYA40866.1 arginine exporter ArgO [Xenorhabdus nematophila]KHD28590.1 arginine exporter protein [Xenorhabdus nematophila]MBA0019615.1 arginine exporter ArgO [Xenorhabdus nematophila]MCB4423972.1 arginine exporter ArgO [Xenorhabdus nematophila]
MLLTLIQGFFLSAAMILPLGPQNVFVMQQGSRKQFHLMSAALCSTSDALLMMAGVFGGSALLSQSTFLLQAVTWGGVAFLLWYGWDAFRTALSGEIELASAKNISQSRWRVIMTLFAVTWLNPHVYLDTFVVLGSIGSQLPIDHRLWFTIGAITASISWFFALSFLSAWCSPVLNQPRSQRIINIFVGCVMWYIAWGLMKQGLQIFH